MVVLLLNLPREFLQFIGVALRLQFPPDVSDDVVHVDDILNTLSPLEVQLPEHNYRYFAAEFQLEDIARPAFEKPIMQFYGN